MIIQIYEIQSAEEAQTMIDLGVDHIGSVILSKDQWKDPEIKAVVDLVGASGRKSSLIPLFQDESMIARCLDYYRPHILHFCENIQGPADSQSDMAAICNRQRFIRRRFPQTEIMRSIPVANNGNGHRVPSVDLARYFEACSDWLLIDTLLVDADSKQDESSQPVHGYVGITGKTCDWNLARQLVSAVKIPVILAGGLGPHNAHDAVINVRPAGIDSCTNTNAVDKQGQPIRFRKDIHKVRAMIEAAQRACGVNRVNKL